MPLNAFCGLRYLCRGTRAQLSESLPTQTSGNTTAPAAAPDTAPAVAPAAAPAGPNTDPATPPAMAPALAQARRTPELGGEGGGGERGEGERGGCGSPPSSDGSDSEGGFGASRVGGSPCCGLPTTSRCLLRNSRVSTASRRLSSCDKVFADCAMLASVAIHLSKSPDEESTSEL